MKPSPYRLVSLLELLELGAEPFCRLTCVMGQLIVMLDTDRPLKPEPVVDTLAQLHRLATDMKWRPVAQHMERVKEHVTSGYATNETLRPMVIQLYDRLRDHLDGQHFLLVELPEFYWQNEPLFGSKISDAFGSEAAEDISEGGKCYALGRYTAGVFHLMRAMEKAVQMLADHLGATVKDRHGTFLTWGVILQNMSDKVKALDKNGAKDWSEVLTLLFHVKEAWRSETMHPKRTYTPEQAREVFDASRSFMRRLATLV